MGYARVDPQRGWTAAEVAVSSAIGSMVLMGAVTLAKVASDSTHQVMSVSNANRRVSALMFDIREDVAQSSMGKVAIAPLPDGNDMVTYQVVVGHFMGPVFGAKWAPIGDVYDRASLMADAAISNQLPISSISWTPPLDGKVPTWKVRYSVMPRGDGTSGLFKLYINLFGYLHSAHDVLPYDVVAFNVSKRGNTVETVLAVSLSTGSGRKETVEVRQFVVPLN